MNRRAARHGIWRLAAFAFLVIAWPPVQASGQTLTLTTVGDAVHVHARGFGFIEGDALARLKNGRSVRFDFEIAVLAAPGGAVVNESRHSFNLSYDLWEERFAVTHIGSSSRATSHLTLPLAEAWCLDRVTLPVSAFGSFGRDAPFWIRLGYRVPDRDRAADAEDDGTGFTLRSLIDRLSRRRPPGEPGRSIEVGPLRLTS